MLPKIFLRKKVSKRIGEGHAWIFANELGQIETGCQPGRLVAVFSASGSFVGNGYFNPDSKIAIRFLTHQTDADINEAWVAEKINEAVNQRKPWLSGSAIIRFVASEADGLPGLTVDKIGDWLVFQIFTLGMENLKSWVVAALKKLFPELKIYEKDQGHFREAEKLPQIEKVWTGEAATTFVFEENGVKVEVDLKNGPRTGIYWEPSLVYTTLAPLVRGKKVFDGFCAEGRLALQLAKVGATQVIGQDWSLEVIQSAKNNLTLNPFSGSEKVHFQKGNTFMDPLLPANGRKFDLMILDTPPLNRFRGNLEKAVAGYDRLLGNALPALASHGVVLLTMSGNLMEDSILFHQINATAKKHLREWCILRSLSQPVDHPFLWNLPASHYFKGWLLRF